MLTEEIIFAGLFKPLEESRDRRGEFLGTFTDPSLFSNVWYVFYSLIRLHPKLTFNRDFIRLHLESNKGTLLKNPHIQMSEYSMGSDDAYLNFIDACLNAFKTCSEYVVDDSEFERALISFRETYVRETGITLLEQGAEILADSLQIGKKTLAGFSDMSAHVVNGISRLSNIINKTNRKGVIVYGAESMQENPPLERVCGYGIPSLDKALGGIYETDMISIIAPPKGGKSRVSAFIIHNAIVQGASVVTWSLENGYKGLEALIRACHFDYLYNRSQADITKRQIIDADSIRKGTLTGAIKEAEQASWMDLCTNPKYGRWANIDETFQADTFLTVIDNAVDMCNAKLILVDYLQLITGDGGVSKNERISQSYQRSLQYLQSKKIAGIFPAQFKQSALGDLSKKSADELASVELRDTGGESSEVVRTPSVLMALYADTQGLRDNTLKLLSIPSRNSAPFPPIDLYADFAVCNFVEMNAE